MSVKIKYEVLDQFSPQDFSLFINYSMDKELFKQRLSEVAEWQLPKLSPSDIKEAGQRNRGRGRPSKESLYQQEHEEVFLDLFEGVNPTMPPELVKVRDQPTTCKDCGQICTQPPRREIKLYRNLPKHVDHWRTRCVECKRYQHPDTKEFSIQPGPACQVFLNWAKAQYSARTKKIKQEIKEDTGVIRKYPDTMDPYK